MKKAILSKIRLDSKEEALAIEFNQCVGGLLNIDEVQMLSNYTQHHNTSRLQHSINVAYYSFLICKKLGLDHKSAARAGILHDLFLYDWREKKQSPAAHTALHPKAALSNAEKITLLNEIEKDAIINHMWPLTPDFPKFSESYAVTAADKFCALFEFAVGFRNSIKNKYQALNQLVFGER